MIDTPEINSANAEELLRTLEELKSMRSQLLAENEQYKIEIQSLTSSLETSGIAVASSEETINIYKEKRSVLNEID